MVRLNHFRTSLASFANDQAAEDLVEKAILNKQQMYRNIKDHGNNVG